ncbi:hypothetical protein [Streptomyces sp. NPDC004589]|uniref:hypothetical protein n=1 Tax=Streptomyces sp. NPDC004589 TaxID=3154553 RepID=UPI0033BA8D27
MPARLLRDLHALPSRDSSDPAVRVLHLDLHPLSMSMTAEGSKVMDRATAEEGAPGLDRGMPAVVLAQVSVVGEPRVDGVRAPPAGQRGASVLTGEGLTEALRRRAENPTMSEREVELLGGAEALIRRTASGTAWRGSRRVGPPKGRCRVREVSSQMPSALPKVSW